jgi:hypothetical protein
MGYTRDQNIGFPAQFVWERKITRAVTTLVSADAVAEAKNLFKIVGAVKVYSLYGQFIDCTDVSSVLTAYLELYDDASHVITKATGTDLSAVTVRSLIGKNAAATTALYLADAADGIVVDGDLGTDFYAAFLAVAQADTDTFIRFNFTSDGGGYNFKINWEAVWMPLFDDSYVTPA